MKKLATLSVLAAGALWGLMGLFVRRLSAAGLTSLEITQLRITGGLFFTGLYLLLFRRALFRVRLRDLWCFAGTGIGSLLFFSYCYFRTILLTSLSTAGVLLYTAPVFVMLMSAVFFREKLTARTLAALAMAVAGCVLVSGVGTGEPLPARGLLLGLGSGLGYALYSIYGRCAINRGYGSLTITFYTFAFCAAGCAPLCGWGRLASVMASDASLWLWALSLSFVTGFAAYLLYTWGLERIESSRASILASVEPVVGTLVGIFVYGEALRPAAAAGVALVLGAVAVLSARKSVNNS